MRTIPDKMRTDEVYVVAFGSFIFINIGHNASKRGTRSCAAVSWMWRSARCDQRRAGDSSGAAEELRAPGQRLKDMNIESHEYAVYAYDTG